MINFEYGGYSLRYNEFQHKLEVKYEDGELLLDAPKFDLGKMYEIYEHLDNYFDYIYHADIQENVLNVMKTDECNPERLLDKTQEVNEFLRAHAYRELDTLNDLLGGYEDEQE